MSEKHFEITAEAEAEDMAFFFFGYNQCISH